MSSFTKSCRVDRAVRAVLHAGLNGNQVESGLYPSALNITQTKWSCKTCSQLAIELGSVSYLLKRARCKNSAALLEVLPTSDGRYVPRFEAMGSILVATVCALDECRSCAKATKMLAAIAERGYVPYPAQNGNGNGILNGRKNGYRTIENVPPNEYL